MRVRGDPLGPDPFEAGVQRRPNGLPGTRSNRVIEDIGSIRFKWPQVGPRRADRVEPRNEHRGSRSRRRPLLLL